MSYELGPSGVHSFSPPVKRRSKKSALSSFENNKIINVYKHVEETWPKEQFIYKKDVAKKTADIVGVGLSTVYKVVKQYNETRHISCTINANTNGVRNDNTFPCHDSVDRLARPPCCTDVTQPANAESGNKDALLPISAPPDTPSSSEIAVKKQEKVAFKQEEKIFVKKFVNVVTQKNGVTKQEKVDIKRYGVTKAVDKDGTEKAEEEIVKKSDHHLKTNGIIGQPWERVCVEVDPAAFFPDEPVMWPECRSNYQSVDTFRCRYCGKGYNMLRALSVHSQSRHGTMAEQRAKPCEVCPAVLCSPRLLDAHRTEHLHDGRLPCLLCMPPLAQPGDTWCGIDESPDREPEPVHVRYPHGKHPTWWFCSVKGLTRHRAAEHPEAGTLGVDWHGQWGDR